MNDKKTISDAISRIIELTRNGAIKWKVEKQPWPTRKGREIDISYIGEYKDRLLRLYVEIGKKNIGIPIIFSSTKLELINIEGIPLWKFPEEPELKELIEAVKYQIADIEGFFQTIYDDSNN